MRKCHHKSNESYGTCFFHGFFNGESGACAIVEMSNGFTLEWDASNVVFEDAPQNAKELAATDSQQLKHAIALVERIKGFDCDSVPSPEEWLSIYQQAVNV